jgi:hypothetical protein
MSIHSEKCGYEIRVKGHLDAYWAAWFEHWQITSLENGDALLSNPHADRSSLHGALNKIRDLNLVLLSVVQIQIQPDEQGKTEP